MSLVAIALVHGLDVAAPLGAIRRFAGEFRQRRSAGQLLVQPCGLAAAPSATQRVRYCSKRFVPRWVTSRVSLIVEAGFGCADVSRRAARMPAHSDCEVVCRGIDNANDRPCFSVSAGDFFAVHN
jgi:hypothetical protein